MKFEHKSCHACDNPISDRFRLEVSGYAWHESCLRCCVCLTPLNEQMTCFSHQNRIYCRDDYNKITQCAKCHRKITSNDWIRRARDKILHLCCFCCDTCHRQLSSGEEFALVQGQILCREHYMETTESETTSSDGDSLFDGDDSKKKMKRVRTAFTEFQLEVLQRNFDIESNPDGQDLERIAEAAELSKRVTQVWFQNARARQKKCLGKRPLPYDINHRMQTPLYCKLTA